MTSAPSSPALDQGIAAIARRDPDRLVLERDDLTLTYAAVDRLADRLAQRLLDEARQVGLAGPDGPPATLETAQTCVPMMLEGTESLLVAAEAVRRAAMVAVPLDPNTPPRRAEHIVRQVRAPFALCDTEASTVGGVKRLHPLEDGTDAPLPVRRPAGRLGSVVFTSGSTGQPKGVMKGPAKPDGILEIVVALFGQEAVRLGIVLAGSASASVPIVEVLTSCGWTIVPFEVRRQHGSASAWLRSSKVRVLAAVPTVLRQMLAPLQPGEVIDGLEFVGLFGEATMWEDVANLRSHLAPGAVIFNIFGQSEAGDIAFMTVDAKTPIGQGRLPVGVPLPGRQVTIVGTDGNPVPAGEQGEIVVQSAGASLGYWEDEASTSEVFFPQPDGSTLVKTGDLGRAGADGALEHLGRLDDMVKVAGNRVDLAEIESTLRSYLSVTDAVATTYVSENGELRLRAFVVLAPGQVANPRVLRGWLLQRLPRWAVPDAVEQLDELPKLPNGKIDRKSLPTGRPRLPQSRAPAGGQASELEERLLPIWRDVLGFEDLGPEDGFFDMGGDSLRAVSLIDQVSTDLGTEVPVTILIENPTVRSMASALATGESARPVVRMQSLGHGMPVIVAHDAFGSLFGARHYLDAMELQQPIFGIRALAWDKAPLIEQSLVALGSRYANEVCEAHPRGALCVVGHASGTLIGFEVARQLQERGRSIGLLVLGGGLPPEPVPLALRRRIKMLRSVPVAELPGAVAALTLSAARYVKTATTSRSQAQPGQPALGPPGDKLAAAPMDQRTAQALSYYRGLLARYRPPGRYHGPALVITPPGANQERLRVWRHWIDGPLRFADPGTLTQELQDGPTRSLECLAP